MLICDMCIYSICCYLGCASDPNLDYAKKGSGNLFDSCCHLVSGWWVAVFWYFLLSVVLICDMCIVSICCYLGCASDPNLDYTIFLAYTLLQYVLLWVVLYIRPLFLWHIRCFNMLIIQSFWSLPFLSFLSSSLVILVSCFLWFWFCRFCMSPIL